MIRRFWRKWWALELMGKHERWRVAMGCPGAKHGALEEGEVALDRLTPRRGEVYCRCERCHAARETVGWDALR